MGDNGLGFWMGACMRWKGGGHEGEWVRMQRLYHNHTS